jgi:hypothetical protein
MTILTNLPVTLSVALPQTVTIDKALFVTQFNITDAFWSNPLNWGEIEFHYESDALAGQTKNMVFTGTTSRLFLKSNYANGNWNCTKITLKDLTGRNLQFARASFPTAYEFDFASTGGYNVNPSPSFGTSWFDVMLQRPSPNPEMVLTIDDSQSFIYLSTYSPIGTYGFGTAKIQSRGLVTTNLTGALDIDLSKHLDDPFTKAFAIDSTGAFAYVAGQFNTRYKSTILPVPTIGEENFMRFAKVDLASGEVTYIGSNNSSNVNAITFDNGVLYYRDDTTLRAVDAILGTLLWSKTITTTNAGLISARSYFKVKVVGGYVYAAGHFYDGFTTNSNKQVIFKIDKATGLSDLSYITGYDGLPASDGGLGFNWDVNTNGIGFMTKNSVNLWIFTGATVNYVSTALQNASVVTFSLKATTARIYIGSFDASKATVFIYDTDGVFINSFNASNTTAPLPSVKDIAVDDDFIYTSLNVYQSGEYPQTENNIKKWDINTLVEQIYVNATGEGNNLNIHLVGGNIFIDSDTSVIIPQNCLFSRGDLQGQTLLKIDLTSKEVVNSTNTLSFYNSGNHEINYPVVSTLTPDKIFTSIDNQLKVFNGIDFTQDNTWPLASGTLLEGHNIDGSFLYICFRGTPFTSAASDSGGAWNNKRILRIDLNTKLIDRTFDPDLSTFVTQGEPTKISFTTDYIYLSAVSGDGNGPRNFRIKKTDNSILYIDKAIYTDIVGTFLSYMTFSEMDLGKLLIFASKATAGAVISPSNRTWMIVDEATLATDSVATSTDNISHSVFDELNKVIYIKGRYGSPQTYIASHNAVTDSSTLYFPDTASMSIEGSPFSEYNFSNSNKMVLLGTTIFNPMVGWIDRKFVSGIIKFDPIPSFTEN